MDAANRSLRILIADGDREEAESLAVLLKMAGHETVAAFDGRRAVVDAAKCVQDVVILDLDLPMLNGYAVAKLLAEKAPERLRPYLIAMHTRSDSEVGARTRNVGFHFFMRKPVDLGQLMSIVERVADRSL